jgi:hypothetical protein
MKGQCMSKQQKHDGDTKKVVSLTEYLEAEDASNLEIGDAKPSSDEKGKTGDSFQDLFNKAVRSTKVDEKGNLVFPDGMTEEMKAAVRAEKKFRDLQRNFQAQQTELKAEKAKSEKLVELIPADDSLTKEEQEELEQLKLTNPDAWYKRKRELEDRASTAKSTKVKEVTSAVAESAKKLSVEEQRAAILETFNAENGTKLSEDVLLNDIPPRLLKKMDEMGYEEFLGEVAEYLGTPKTVVNEKVDNVTNIGKTGDVTKVETKELDTDILYKEEVI